MYTTKSNVSHTLSEEGMRRFKEFYDKELLDVYEYEQYSNKPLLQGVMEENDPIEEVRYAYDNNLLKKLKVLDGTFDPEKFKSGDYILVTAFHDLEETFYKPGDKIKLNYHTDASKEEMLYDKEGNFKQTAWANDISKEYEVMAVVELPYSMTTRSFPWNAITTILPIDEFLARDKDAMCFCTSYWIKDDKEAAFQSFVEAYTTKIDPNTDYASKETLRKEFSSMSGAIGIVGVALSIIIGMIGVLNFINTILTSVITRKRELAMLQSIGMTDAQLKLLLIYEGLYYIIFTALSSLIIGSVLSLSVVRAMENVVSYFEYQYTVLPYVVMLPAFFLIGILVPEIAYRKAKRQSIIVRLREAE
jgi:putative ABC transport system permease protein